MLHFCAALWLAGAPPVLASRAFRESPATPHIAQAGPNAKTEPVVAHPGGRTAPPVEIDRDMKRRVPILIVLGIAAAFGIIAVHRWLARNTPSKAALWSVWAVVLFALAVRLKVVIEWDQAHPHGPRQLFGDEPGYNDLALSILYGFGFDWPARVPLYPLWLAGLHWLTGGSYRAIPYAQALLGTGTVLLT